MNYHYNGIHDAVMKAISLAYMLNGTERNS